MTTRSIQRSGAGKTVRGRAATLLALLALLGQMFATLLPMPVLAADGTPICALDASGKPDKSQSGHMSECPVCQAAQLLASLTPPAPVAVPVVYRRVERVAAPSVATAQPRRAASHRQARAPPAAI